MGTLKLEDGTCWPWPVPDAPDKDALEYRLRYGEPTRSEILSAAEVLNAYTYLLDLPITQATAKLRMLKRARRPRSTKEGT